MILIISDTFEQSTCKVIDWLLFFNKKYIVITDKTLVDVIEIDIPKDFTISINNQYIKYSEICSVWYRRGFINICNVDINNKIENIEVAKAMSNTIKIENKSIEQYLNYMLLRKKNVNNFLYSRVNKLLVLQKAFEIGLNIPNSVVTNDKNILQNLQKNHKHLITKTIAEASGFESENFLFTTYTEKVTKELINTINDKFYHSFFQKQIDKKYEIRTFYLDGKCYSMAIFSQQNNKTKIDFRKYDNEFPNRNVPFKLPIMIENKIKILMDSFNLNSGSLDFIYGTDSKFYFLEINPIGQFGMVSYPCNYNLEKKIAEFLSNNSHE